MEAEFIKDECVNCGEVHNIEEVCPCIPSTSHGSEYVTPKKAPDVAGLLSSSITPGAPRKETAQFFSCDVCSKHFTTISRLEIHLRKSHGEKKYSCETCGKGFNSKFKLVRHKLIHSRLREWTCSRCGRSFRRKDHLEAHIKYHCGERTLHPCHVCSKTYSCKGSLRKHLALHGALSGNLTCQLCAFTANSKEAIVAHVRAHSSSRVSKEGGDSRRYRCSDCDRLFLTRKDAKRHSVVHTKRRDYLCQYCPRAFGRSDHLTRHIEKAHERKRSPVPSTSASTSFQPLPEPLFHLPQASEEEGEVVQTGTLPRFSQAFSAHSSTVAPVSPLSSLGQGLPPDIPPS